MDSIRRTWCGPLTNLRSLRVKVSGMTGDDGLCGELPELIQQLLDEQRRALPRSNTQTRRVALGENTASVSTHGIDFSQPTVKGS